MLRTETPPDTKPLAVPQMLELEKEYEQLKTKLELWRQESKQLLGLLADLRTKQDKAEQLLDFTKNIDGCRTERDLASRALEQCAEQGPKLEQRLEGNCREVKRQEQALKRIDVTAFAPLAKIRALAIGL